MVSFTRERRLQFGSEIFPGSIWNALGCGCIVMDSVIGIMIVRWGLLVVIVSSLFSSRLVGETGSDSMGWVSWSEVCGMLVSNGGCVGSSFSGADAMIVPAAWLSLVPCLDESVHSPLPPPVHRSIEENVKGVSLCEENECMWLSDCVSVDSDCSECSLRKPNAPKKTNETNIRDSGKICSVTTCSQTTWCSTGCNAWRPTSDCWLPGACSVL